MPTRFDGTLEGAVSFEVLLIEDNAGDEELIRAACRTSGRDVKIEHAATLETALRALDRRKFDVVLADLTLPDSFGLETVVALHAEAPRVPLVVLTGLDDEETALKAIHAGAQDYLVKDHLNSGLILRSMRYAIERHALLEKVRSLSLEDELTRVHNRRGFLVVSQQLQRIARRNRCSMFLAFIDLDGLKGINDTFGHQEGDTAIIITATLLRQTLRESDVLGRIGGDEFAVLALGDPGVEVDPFIDRLMSNLDQHNAEKNGPYRLSVSAGSIRIEPDSPRSLEDHLAEADALMYTRKKEKLLTSVTSPP